MNWLKKTLVFASLPAMFVGASRAFALNEADMREIREYVESTRAITVKDKEASLKIGGEVRAGHRYFKDRVGGQKMSGRSSGYSVPVTDPTLQNWTPGGSAPTAGIFYPPTPSSVFPIKARLSLEYDKNETYAHSLLQFDNHGGIEDQNYDSPFAGGRPHYGRFKPGKGGISLARAIYGYRFLDADQQKLSLEVGRRQMDDIFLSPVQFNSTFDGALVRYKNSELEIGDLTLDAGTFLIDPRVYHIGQAMQLGLVNPSNGLFASYSLINWHKDGQYADGTWGNLSKANTSGAMENMSYRFMNSQGIVGMALPEEMLGKITKLSVGALVNHKAKKVARSSGKKDNTAYFATLEYGDAKSSGKAGDWKVVASLQKVGSQAVQESEARSGVGSPGQTLGIPFYYPSNDGSLGFGNFKGMALQGTYAIKEGVLFSVDGAYAVPNRKLGRLRQTGKNSFTYLHTQISYIF